MSETDRDLQGLFDQTGAEPDLEAWTRLSDDDPSAEAALAAQFDATAAPLDELTQRRLLAPYLANKNTQVHRLGGWLGLAAAAALTVWLVRPTPQPVDMAKDLAPVAAAVQVEPATVTADPEALVEFGPELEQGEVQVADNTGDPAEYFAPENDLDQGLDALHGLEGAPPLAMP